MAKPLIDTVLLNARTIVADRRLRLLGTEAVTADGRECDACDDDAQRFCAVGALIRAAYVATRDQEQAHRLGWRVAGLIADAANLRRVDEDEPGWSLAMLNDRRGQAAVLRAIDALIGQRGS
jgi:hypothetical protein